MRFFSSTLASLVQKASVSYYMARLESRPSFSSQAQAPERGHHHLANRPLQAVSQSLHTQNCNSKSASPTVYFPDHLPMELLFSLEKVKLFPTEHGKPLSLISFPTCIISLHPILTSELDQMNFLLLSFPPSFPRGYLYPEYLSFLIHWTILPLIWKGHFQVILSRKLSWSRWLQADSSPAAPCLFAR